MIICNRLSVLTIICGSLSLCVGGAMAGSAHRAAACGLLSPADIERVLHAPVGDGGPRVNTEVLTTCSFSVAQSGSVSILLRRDSLKEWSGEQRNRMTCGISFRPVSGLGDAAFVLDRRPKGVTLCVFLGANYLQVSVLGLGDSDSVLPAATALARKALCRLRAS